MGIFLSVFIFENVFLYLYSILKTNEKKTIKILCNSLLALAVAIPVFFFGFRALSVGTDTNAYNNIFEYCGNLTNFKGFFTYEFGYSLLNFIIYKMNCNFTVLLCVVGLIMYLSLFYAIKHFSLNYAISISTFMGLGMYAQSMNIMRQYLALSMVLIGLVFLLKKNNNWLFLLFVLFGCFFHKTAIIGLIFLFLKYLKFNYKTLISFVVLSILGVLFFPYIAKLFDLIANTHYYNSYKNVVLNGFDIKDILFIVAILTAFAIAVIFRDRVLEHCTEEQNKIFDFFMLAFAVFICSKIISLYTVELVDRFGLYFLVSLIFIVPQILNSFNEKTKKILSICLTIGLLCFQSYVLGIIGIFDVVPYRIIWF